MTADTMHGLVIGEESRQQLYTMLTRGRSANHVYVSVVGDGDPHGVIQPDSLHPRTATELLEQILARDEAPQSATTMQRERQDPVAQLGAATARYLDALHLAAEHVTGPQVAASLDQSAGVLLNGLLSTPAPQRGLTGAHHQAAVVDSRMQDMNEVAAGGPLPWLPGIPDHVAGDPNWAPYLDARSRLVAQLADLVRINAGGEAPAWAAQLHAPVPAELIADIQVWRAATQIDPSELRPTGPPQPDRATRIWQHELDQRLAAADACGDRQWRQLLAMEVPRATTDPFMPELEGRLNNLTRAGFDATDLVRSAAAAGRLPDDHPAAALWWRILDQLPSKTPEQDLVTPDAGPATRRTIMTSHEPQPQRPRPAPPAFGPSR